MRNLWIFISKYDAFFLFIIFFGFSIYLVVKNNTYQRSTAINSTNKIVGGVYQNLNVFKQYLNLNKVNDSLVTENATLKTALIALKNKDTLKNKPVTDTANHVQYLLVAAKVIKNSVTLRNNIITINKGSADGITKDMAVISTQNGVVGFVMDVAEHSAIIRSLLHKDTKISVSIKKTNALGSLVWGDGNFDIRKAYVKEIPNHIKFKLGDTIVTSGFSSFPAGIAVGKISNTGVAKGDNFMSIEINLFNDFSTLQYVYVVKDKLAVELKTLEAKIINEQ